MRVKEEPELRASISQYMFSIIDSEVRHQIVWRQYIDRDGKVMGIGSFRPVRTSYMEDRIRKMRTDYLKRIRKNVPR